MVDATPEPDPGSPGTGAGGGASLGPQEKEQIKNLLLFLPRLAAMIVKLLTDPEVSALDKALLGAVVLYIVSPLDILPDFVPVIGQLDDIYLVALALLRLLNRSGEAKLHQHWDGPENIVQILTTVTDFATRYLPSQVRSAVRAWVDAKVGGADPPSGAA